MSRLLLTLAATGAALGLSLANPLEARAQTPFGVRVNVGGTTFGLSSGYYGPGFNGAGAFGPGFGTFAPSYYGNGFGNAYYGNRFYGGLGHHHHGRPAIVQPDFSHWTPGRGVHSHGTVLVPHRGHYDAYRY
jgi:hypothetical protein